MTSPIVEHEPPRRLPTPVMALEGANFYWRSKAQTSYWASVAAATTGHMSRVGARGTSAMQVAPDGSARLVSVARTKPPDALRRYRCYAIDDRPWAGPPHPAAAYVYSENRRGEHPLR